MCIYGHLMKTPKVMVVYIYTCMSATAIGHCGLWPLCDWVRREPGHWEKIRQE